MVYLLTFSSNNRTLLRNIFGMISKIVEDEGFTVNKNKTTFMTPKSHKYITGVTVNDKVVKAPRQLKKLVRTMLHRSIITGDYSNLNKIRGYISYINSIEKGYKEKIIDYVNSFKDDTVTLFMDAVEAFNSNKIFKQVNDLVQRSPGDFVEDELDKDEYLYMATEEREEFLLKFGYIKEKSDTFKSDDSEDTPDCPF